MKDSIGWKTRGTRMHAYIRVYCAGDEHEVRDRMVAERVCVYVVVWLYGDARRMRGRKFGDEWQWTRDGEQRDKSGMSERASGVVVEVVRLGREMRQMRELQQRMRSSMGNGLDSGIGVEQNRVEHEKRVGMV